jgi:hypothetical protein
LPYARIACDPVRTRRRASIDEDLDERTWSIGLSELAQDGG